MKINYNIPCSKSYAQRCILIGLFYGGHVRFNGIKKDNISSDVVYALKFLDALGIKYSLQDCLEFDSTNIDFGHVLERFFECNCGESGTLARMLIPILARYNCTCIVNGTGSLLNRNLDSIKPFFDLTDVKYKSNDGKLPIILNGQRRKKIENGMQINGQDTSQYISGIIIASCLDNIDCDFYIQNCFSIDYVKLTVDILKKFKYDIELDGSHVIIKKTDIDKSNLLEIDVENDWSCIASYLVYIASIKADAQILCNSFDSCQCDMRILDILKSSYNIKYDNDILTLTFEKQLKPFVFDCSTSPDLFPIVCTLAATIQSGYSEVIGLDRLVNKESDRGKVMYDELEKYGISVKKKDNSLLIKGNNVHNATFNSHNDHRISMALIILRKYYGLNIPEKDKCLEKSYPNFIESL